MKSFTRSLPIKERWDLLSFTWFVYARPSIEGWCVCVSVPKSSGVDASAAKRFIICLHELVLVLCSLSSSSLFEREWVTPFIWMIVITAVADDAVQHSNTAAVEFCPFILLPLSLVLRVECSFSFPPVCLTLSEKESVRGPEEEMFCFLLRFVSTLL